MDSFSYVSGLATVILALGITRLLTGVGRLLQQRGRITLYWVHLFWVLNVFLFLLLNWWILYRWHIQKSWNFFLLIFVLLSPIVTFLLTVLLFPEPVEAGLDLKQHFYTNRRSFFVLSTLLPVVDMIDTVLKGKEHFLAQGWIYPITIILLFVLMVVASRTDRESYHKFFAVFFLVYILAFITTNLLVLS